MTFNTSALMSQQGLLSFLDSFDKCLPLKPPEFITVEALLLYFILPITILTGALMTWASPNYTRFRWLRTCAAPIIVALLGNLGAFYTLGFSGPEYVVALPAFALQWSLSACILLLKTTPPVLMTGPPGSTRKDWKEVSIERRSLWDKLLFALDLMISWSGASCFRDCAWSWKFGKLETPQPKTRFLWSNFQSLVLEHLVYCVATTCLWIMDLSSRRSMYDYPLVEQLWIAFLFFWALYSGMAQAYRAIAMVSVVIGMPTTAWPPLFRRPFLATSIVDFWGFRWHNVLRRTFTVVGNILGGRLFGPFIVSGLMHQIIHIHMQRSCAQFPVMVLLCFVVQPLGIIFERVVLSNLPGHRVWMRVWVWFFLLYTSRWGVAVWVQDDMMSRASLMLSYLTTYVLFPILDVHA